MAPSVAPRTSDSVRTMRFVASCVFALSLGISSVAEAKEMAAPEAPPPNEPAGTASAPLAPAAPPLGGPQPAIAETYEEPEMHSVGMFAAGIALVIGGVVNSAIGIGIIAATTSSGGDGFGGVIAAIVGAPILFDGTIQISVGIPLIVVGGADAEMEPDPVEHGALEGLPMRSGLTLAAPF